MDAFPRALRNPAEIERRRAMLSHPRVAPLANFAAGLRQRLACEVPDFDPLDGGVEAQILFLFEKPGPMTAVDGRGRRSGSGFISRDNDDPTAEATFRFMQEAGIPRGDAVLWNAVPGWNGTRRITGAEIRAGMASLKELINLLHRLRVVVLVGKNAGRVQSFVPSSYAVLTSAHPSPLVRARWPEKWRGIGRQWSKALHPENL